MPTDRTRSCLDGDPHELVQVVMYRSQLAVVAELMPPTAELYRIPNGERDGKPVTDSEADLPTYAVGITDEAAVMALLEDGPKSHAELGALLAVADRMVANGLLVTDADRFPDEYVPGNPMIYRTRRDRRPWPGWQRWNV